MAHQCPAPACTEQVDDDRLMCSRDWYQVPAALRKAVWTAWKGGDGAGTPAHAAAVAAAIRSLGNRRDA